MVTGAASLKTDIKGMPNDGRLVAVSNFNQIQSVFNGYKKLAYEPGETLIIVSASIDNSYLLFGFKETPFTLQRSVDQVEIFAIESTTIKPKFEVYPTGVRLYSLRNWEEIGYDMTSIN